MRKLISFGIVFLMMISIAYAPQPTTTKTTATSTTTNTLINQDLFNSKNITNEDILNMQIAIKKDIEARYKVSVASINLQPIIKFKLLNNHFIVTLITLTNGKRLLLISNTDAYTEKYINTLATKVSP